MKRRPWLWGATLMGLVAALLGLAWSLFGHDQISMTQAEIQSRIDARMPASHLGVTVSRVTVVLANDRINLTIDGTAKLFEAEGRLQATTRGTLRYENSSGEFYFHPESVSIGGTLGRVFDSRRALLQKGAEYVLARVPVYTVKRNFKGTVIRAVLKEVEVRDGRVIAHLSVWKLTITLAIFALLFVASLVTAISLSIRSPERSFAGDSRTSGAV